MFCAHTLREPTFIARPRIFIVRLLMPTGPPHHFPPSTSTPNPPTPQPPLQSDHDAWEAVYPGLAGRLGNPGAPWLVVTCGRHEFAAPPTLVYVEASHARLRRKATSRHMARSLWRRTTALLQAASSENASIWDRVAEAARLAAEQANQRQRRPGTLS